jgi:phospholipase C
MSVPGAFSEHGNWPTNYGAWYISQFLDALVAHPAGRSGRIRAAGS